MTYQEEISVSTKGFCDVVDITDRVSDIVSDSKIKEGIVVVFSTSSTSAITTIEHEPNLVKDFEELLEKIIPKNKQYHHGATWGDDNGFSHLRASLIGPSLAVPISKGKMTLGTWENVVLCDFDNRSRERTLIVKVVGE
ncbi:secondary thiamine-phosphate synthase enzyme YjbQ [Patescibacteria group bacterium AH-259-L05]|nr:secondary thiamine-phosphate synthase enzyme YjbQ [Patescibacteria group bacterium AH-259-L05]